MLFKKDFEMYWDRIWDACTDTGVGTPHEGSERAYKVYFKQVQKNDYHDFARWLWRKNFKMDKEIEFFNKKYLDGMNSREASYQVLSYEFDKWIIEIWDSIKELNEHRMFKSEKLEEVDKYVR